MAKQLDSESGIDPETFNPESLDPEGLSFPEALSFEEAFRRLGEVVDSLESGGLPLAEATGIYQQGMGLVRRCNQLLNESQLKITQLTNSLDEAASSETNSGDILEWDEEPEV